MGRRKEIIDEELVKKAQEDVKKIKDYKIIIRLQAIIGGRYPLKEVREILGVSRHSVRLWAKRYKEEGLDGLSDKKKGHRRRKLGEEEESEIRRWLRGMCGLKRKEDPLDNREVEERDRGGFWDKDKQDAAVAINPANGFQAKEFKTPGIRRLT